MRALCPTCGGHHEVVQVLDLAIADAHQDVYQVAPVEGCSRSYITDRELLEARSRFDVEAVIPDDDE